MVRKSPFADPENKQNRPKFTKNFQCGVKFAGKQPYLNLVVNGKIVSVQY